MHLQSECIATRICDYRASLDFQREEDRKWIWLLKIITAYTIILYSTFSNNLITVSILQLLEACLVLELDTSPHR